MPTEDGFTASQTSMYGWPTTRTSEPVTDAAIRDSLEPGTRWSTSTPSRASGAGEKADDDGGQVVHALQVLHDDALDPQVVAPDPLDQLGVVPALDVDPPGPRDPRLRARHGDRPGRRTAAARAGRAAARGRTSVTGRPSIRKPRGVHREHPQLAEPVLQRDRQPLGGLLHPHHGAAEARRRLLDHQVGLRGDLGRRARASSTAGSPRQIGVVTPAAHAGDRSQRPAGARPMPGAETRRRACRAGRVRTRRRPPRRARARSAPSPRPAPAAVQGRPASCPGTASSPACGSPDSSTRSPQKTTAGSLGRAPGTRTTRSWPVWPGPGCSSRTGRPPRSSASSPGTGRVGCTSAAAARAASSGSVPSRTAVRAQPVALRAAAQPSSDRSAYTSAPGKAAVPKTWSKWPWVSATWVTGRPVSASTCPRSSAPSRRVDPVSTSSTPREPTTRPIVTSRCGSRRRATPGASCSQTAPAVPGSPAPPALVPSASRTGRRYRRRPRAPPSRARVRRPAHRPATAARPARAPTVPRAHPPAGGAAPDAR